MDSQRLPRVAVPHPSPAEEDVQAIGQILRPLAGLAGVREPAEREHGEVARGDDVDLVPRPPHLHERGVLPGGRPSAFDPRVDRQERRSGHAVLKTGPRRTLQRTLPPWQPLIERSDAPSEREDLRSRDPQSRRPGHVTSSESARGREERLALADGGRRGDTPIEGER